jgi:hypothetical protein
MVIKGELEEWRGQREEVIALLELKGDESLGLICSMKRPKRIEDGGQHLVSDFSEVL